jgi:hypothetical protein
VNEPSSKYCSICAGDLITGYDSFRGYHIRCDARYCNLCGDELNKVPYTNDNVIACNEECVNQHNSNFIKQPTDGSIYAAVSRRNKTPEELAEIDSHIDSVIEYIKESEKNK